MTRVAQCAFVDSSTTNKLQSDSRGVFEHSRLKSIIYCILGLNESC